jgi:hypothetical protein
MVKYRVVFLSSRGQPFGYRHIDAKDDADAIQWAKRSFVGVEMEILCNDCVIARVESEATTRQLPGEGLLQSRFDCDR